MIRNLLIGCALIVASFVCYPWLLAEDSILGSLIAPVTLEPPSDVDEHGRPFDRFKWTEDQIRSYYVEKYRQSGFPVERIDTSQFDPDPVKRREKRDRRNAEINRKIERSSGDSKQITLDETASRVDPADLPLEWYTLKPLIADLKNMAGLRGIPDYRVYHYLLADYAKMWNVAKATAHNDPSAARIIKAFPERTELLRVARILSIARAKHAPSPAQMLVATQLEKNLIEVNRKIREHKAEERQRLGIRVTTIGGHANAETYQESISKQAQQLQNMVTRSHMAWGISTALLLVGLVFLGKGIWALVGMAAEPNADSGD